MIGGALKSIIIRPKSHPSPSYRKEKLAFSFSEASAKANAICLSIADTAKRNGVDF